MLSCRSSNNKEMKCDKSFCDSCSEISAMLYDEFSFTNDSSYLDSSLFVINRALHECSNYEYYVILCMRKLCILSDKREFESASLFLDSVDLKKRIPVFPYLQSVYHNRLVAMQYQEAGDMRSKDSCLNLVVEELNGYLTENKIAIDSMLCERNIVSIEKSVIDFPLKQYFYYLTALKGRQKVDSIIDSIQQVGDYNQDYIETLRDIYDDEFMRFWGI